MKKQTIKGNWNIAKGWVEQKLGRWMDDVHQFTKGKEDELTGRIQKRSVQLAKSGARKHRS